MSLYELAYTSLYELYILYELYMSYNILHAFSYYAFL